MYDNMFPKFEPFSPGVEKQLQENYDRKKKAEESAIEQTNIQRNIEDNLNVVIQNQKQIIDTLNERIRTTNELLEKLMELSKDTFTSQEDGVAISKEIYKLILDNNKSGFKDFIKDKGGDVAVQGLFVLLQTVLSGGILI